MIYKAYFFAFDPYSTENAEVLTALLDKFGFEGIHETEETLVGYIPAEYMPVYAIDEISSALSKFNCDLNYTIEDIAEQNWNELWESNFEPVIIDTRCVVRAPFHKQFPDILYQITIEPKMSFGTGHHYTTRMMMEKIIETNIKGKHVLDMGCGTAVLSILASFCGAATVTALDNDKWAYENSLENIRKNNCNNIEVILGGKESIPESKFDLILANINRNILIDQMGIYSLSVEKNGMLIISGILLEDIEILKHKAGIEGFYSESEKISENWVMLTFRRN